MPLANILIGAFIIGMAYWWALQGFFSSLLHLVLVIAAGSLALALWEPLVLNLGMKMQPMYCWGLWLLGPFVLILVVLRLVVDKLVPKNVNFQNLVSSAGGAVLGVFSAILTAGLAVIGLGLLPLDTDLGGYEPYMVDGRGRIDDSSGDNLWVPVDKMANGFFVGLANSSFSTSTPLGTYRPFLPRFAALHRMRYDENASVVAVPGSVSVEGFIRCGVPLEELDAAIASSLGQPFKNQDNTINLVQTTWNRTAGTFDEGDSAVRVPPTQIRLVAQHDTTGQMTLHAPVAFTRYDPEEGQRRFVPIDSATTMAFGNRQVEKLGWVFILPADEAARFIFIRNLRLELPEFNRDPQRLAAALGQSVRSPPEDLEAGEGKQRVEGEVGPRQGPQADHVATQIEVSNQLPGEIGKNSAHGLVYHEHEGENQIDSGRTPAAKRPMGYTRRTRVKSIYVPEHQVMVRLRIEADRAKSLLGRSRTAAASLGGVWLVDSHGEMIFPIGYVWHRHGEQEIAFDRFNVIRSARDLPVTKMRKGHTLYLYFTVPKPTTIVRYSIGGQMNQEVSLRAE